MSDKATQLLEAAIDLFAKEGFWNTPTSRIAKHAGVATGTLFNYFESKDVLIDAVYLKLKHEWSTHLQADMPMDNGFKVAAEHVWFRFIEWGMQNPTRHTLMMQLKLSNLVSEEAQQRQEAEMAFGYTLIEQGIKEGCLREVDPKYFGMMWLTQLETAVSYATQHQLRDMPLTKFIAHSFALFWGGVAQ